jgi:ribonuclease P protein component
MPARPARLKRRSDFLRVAAARRKAVTPGLVLQARRRGETDDDHGAQTRVGYTASRKVGNAVDRNRARRRLKALADDILTQRADPATDYVLIARRALLARPYGALKVDLESALSRVHEATERTR